MMRQKTSRRRRFVEIVVIIGLLLYVYRWLTHDDHFVGEEGCKQGQSVTDVVQRITNNKVANNMSLSQRQQISEGYRRMRNSTVMICALIRNGANLVPNFIHNALEISSHFSAAEIVMIENDSFDDTREVLSKWASFAKQHMVPMAIISNSYMMPGAKEEGETAVSRFQIMSVLRNQCLFEKRRRPHLQYHIMMDIVIDLDHRSFEGKDNPASQMDGIAHSFGMSERWDAVCSNGVVTKPAAKTVVPYMRSQPPFAELAYRINDWSRKDILSFQDKVPGFITCLCIHQPPFEPHPP